MAAMKPRWVMAIASVLLAATAAFAHGDNDHVRGVVTAVTPQSITVQTQANKTIVLAVTPQTVFEKAGAKAQETDLKVGDRVIADVPKDAKGATREASLVRFGSAAKTATKTGTK